MSPNRRAPVVGGSPEVVSPRGGTWFLPFLELVVAYLEEGKVRSCVLKKEILPQVHRLSLPEKPPTAQDTRIAVPSSGAGK
ncbi:hypothetical protein HY969_01720 [Candidatus Kaiserbacteria bacterium]|nr:hypothetical protein [Candidatus Kaiserbacteria bacterium]